MECDVDIARFTEVPYAVERPAGNDDFADTVTEMLSRAGLRLEFGSAADVSRASDDLLARELPPGIGMVTRSGKVFRSAGAETLVSGSARATTFSGQPEIETAFDGWTMLGHAINGADRAQASAFSSILAIRSGATPDTLTTVMKRREYGTASASWNAAARMTGYVDVCREKLIRSPGFSSASAVALGRTAIIIAATGLDREYLPLSSDEERILSGIRNRLQRSLGANADPQGDGLKLASSLGERFSTPAGVHDENTEKSRFEARPFGTKHHGPSYLPTKKFNEESVRIVQGLHPDLLRVVARAAEISGQEFQVVPDNGGLRTASMQKRLKKKGASRAILGRHTIGYAIDLVPVNDQGRVDFTNLAGFDEIMLAMKQASEELSVPIDWGGNWKRLVDKPHFELNRKVYPGPRETAKPSEVLVAFR
jgi:peptidoglycan L-alanyl-D-glutamate endopeptidase CwlK